MQLAPKRSKSSEANFVLCLVGMKSKITRQRPKIHAKTLGIMESIAGDGAEAAHLSEDAGLVREQWVLEVLLLCERCVLLWRVAADAKHDCSLLGEGRVLVTELASLFCAAGGPGLCVAEHRMLGLWIALQSIQRSHDASLRAHMDESLRGYCLWFGIHGCIEDCKRM